MKSYKRTTSLLADVEQLVALKDNGITQATAFELGCTMLLGNATQRILMYQTLIQAEQNKIEICKARITEMEGFIYDIENMPTIEEIQEINNDIDEHTVEEFQKCAFNIIFLKKRMTLKHLASISKKSVHEISTFYSSFKNVEPTVEEIKTFLRG